MIALAAEPGWSTPMLVLLVVGALQVAFIVLLVLFILLNRLRLGRRTAQGDVAVEAIRQRLTDWLLEPTAARLDSLRASLRVAPAERALEELLVAAGARIPPTARRVLADALRDEPWLRAVLARHRSRLWWRRLAAARAYGLVGTGADAPALARLLADRHPAVQAAATSTIARVASPELVATVLDRLPRSAPVVRRLQFAALREVWPVAAAALRPRLAPHRPPGALAVWVQLAEHLQDPATIEVAVRLASHPDARVRSAVASLLRHYYDERASRILLGLLSDEDEAVRAEAARASGALGLVDHVPHLASALEDGAWAVRFRAALSLAQLGERGREALRSARSGPDRYARDMAAMVGGLSIGGVLELAEG